MEWVKVFSGKEEALQRIAPMKPQLVIIGVQRICLIRFKDQFSAVQDDCSHKGESLSRGHVNFLGEVVCPLHDYCFETRTGRESRMRSADLQVFPIKIDETGFFIGI